MLRQTLFFLMFFFFTRKASSTTITYYLVDSWKGQWIDSENLCLQQEQRTFKTLGQFILRDLGHPDVLEFYQVPRKAKILLIKCVIYNWHIKIKSKRVFLCMFYTV